MAATKLWQPYRGIIDFKAFESIYDKTFDEIKVQKDMAPREGAQFFSERSTNLETYKEGEMWSQMEVPQENEDTDRIPLFSALEGYNKSFTNIQYRSGFVITRRAISAQKTRKIAALLKGLPSSTMKLEELSYASIFNGGFATETTGDGSYLFATDHYLEDPQHGTWTNTPASGAAFSSVTYFAAWLNLQQRVDPLGFPAPQKASAVYYNVAKQEDVSKVHGSDLYPQNSLNAKLDPLFSSFRMVPGHWLTSTDPWFVQGSDDEADKGLVIVWELKPQYDNLKDTMNPGIVMGKCVTMAFSVGAIHGRNWYGNPGT